MSRRVVQSENVRRIHIFVPHDYGTQWMPCVRAAFWSLRLVWDFEITPNLQFLITPAGNSVTDETAVFGPGVRITS